MRATVGLDGVPGMEDATLRLSEAAIRAGSAFYETAAAAGEASARADDLASSAAAAADAATAPLESLQALRDAVAASDEDAGVPPSGSLGSGDAGGTGDPLGGVDKALGDRDAGGRRGGEGDRRSQDRGGGPRPDPADQRRAEPRLDVRRAHYRGDDAEGVDRLGHRPARRAGADPGLRDAALRDRLRHRTPGPDRELSLRADRAGVRRAGRWRASPTSSASGGPSSSCHAHRAR